jgi:hypothetical protein
LKPDAPVLTGAPQKIEDPGHCRDPFHFEEQRRTPNRRPPDDPVGAYPIDGEITDPAAR